ALDEPGGMIPRGVLGSEPGDVHAAVDVDDLSGGVGHATGRELYDGAGNVSGCAPPGHGGQSVGELLVVLLLDPGGHVRGDHARAHLVDRNAFGGQAGGEELGGHGDPGLGDAVLAAVGGDRDRRGGGDIDDRAADTGFSGSGRFQGVLGAHHVRNPLGEEVGAAQVDA